MKINPVQLTKSSGMKKCKNRISLSPLKWSSPPGFITVSPWPQGTMHMQDKIYFLVRGI